jgi:hypothetical protein
VTAISMTRALFAFVVLLSHAYQAGATSFVFSGSISAVVDPDSILDSSVTKDASFTGSISFEPRGIPLGASPTWRRELFYSGDLQVSVGALTVRTGLPSTQPLQVSVYNGGIGYYCATSCDQYNFGLALPFSTGPPVRGLDVFFTDASASAISSLDFPSVPPDLAVLAGRLEIGGFTEAGPHFSITGNVSSITATPEPSLGVLSAVGTLSIAGWRRQGIERS